MTVRALSRGTACLLCAAAATAPALALGATTTDYIETPALIVAGDDAELEAAQARAKQGLGQFLQRLRSRSGTDIEFAVQAEITRGDVTEAVWLSGVRLGRRNHVSGRVHADPILLSELRAGQSLTIALAQVTDWVIVERTLTGERVVGGYTVKLMREREVRGIVPEYLAHDAGVL